MVGEASGGTQEAGGNEPQLSGSGVALHAKPAVAAEAKIRIDHGDLTALLYIQGYRKTDFVAPPAPR